MSYELSEPFKYGVRSYLSCISQKKCPHPHHDSFHEDWLAGWRMARGVKFILEEINRDTL